MFDAYLVMHENEVYLVSKKDIGDVLSEMEGCRIIENRDNPPGAYSMPTHVQIQATRKCNLKCITCGVAADSHPAESGYEEIMRTIDILAENGVLNIEWSGGEPLVRKDFWKFVEHASTAGINQGLLTNGILFTEENIGRVKEFFCNVQISLDGIGNVFDRIVGRSAWLQFTKSIALAVKEGIENFHVATVLQEDNAGKISDIINFCSDNGVRNIRISPLVPIGRSSHVTWEQYSQIINKFESIWSDLKKLALARGVAINCFIEKERCDDKSVTDVGNLISPGGYNFLYVDASGFLYPFPFLASDEFKLGNIQHEDLRDIWFNSSMLGYLRKQNYKNTGCGECRLECSFAERSLVYAFTGKIDGPALNHKDCPVERR